MIKITCIIPLFILIGGCAQPTGNEPPKAAELADTVKTTAASNPVRPRYHNLPEVIAKRGDTLLFWSAKDSYYPALTFDNKDTLSLEFDGQCSYSYPFKKENEVIVVYWDFVMNCTHDIGLKESFGLKEKPGKGKPFMKLRLVDDTTLEAHYLYPEWIMKFNDQYKGYKLFPERFLAGMHVL